MTYSTGLAFVPPPYQGGARGGFETLRRDQLAPLLSKEGNAGRRQRVSERLY